MTEVTPSPMPLLTEMTTYYAAGAIKISLLRSCASVLLNQAQGLSRTFLTLPAALQALVLPGDLCVLSA